MSTNKRRTVCNLAIQNIQDQLAKFWLIEEPPGNKGLTSQEDKVCEEIFVKTLERSPDGRFVVEIPFKEPISRLGDSKQVALKRLYSLENKFAEDPQLKQAYCDFMSTYEKAGYMVLVPNPEIDTTVSYYLPHHGVLKKDSTTTPLRVVFDGSSLSDTNVSLNQLQYVGPQDVQSDLYSILLRFRSHNIVISGDISKMFLQIKVKERQGDLLLVLWRSEPSEEVKTYCLTTVPFGLRSSPFLAVRCLKQLSLENAELHPIACDIISNDFYMDDLLSGTSTEEEAIQVCKDIFSILKSSGFMLGKWKSNSVNVLNAMQVINTSNAQPVLTQNQTKTLGLYWDSDKDFLKFRVSKADECKTITKRTMLSEIAQIFDPLGLVSPSIVVVKILLQSLWQANISWDNEIPNDVLLKWKQFKRELPLLNSIEIPRHVICKNPARIELHGFCDASTKAYGAVVYLRSVDVSGNIQVTLLCSKSKVAPIKMLTTPRLELCGALVLAQLVSKVKEALNIHIDDTFLWSDSTVVLNWIRASPNQFQIFIANRITQIQNATSMDYWHYINTKENPADLVSCGVLPSKLIANKLWLHGPLWLQEASECWRSYSSLIPPVTDLPERKKQVLVMVSKPQCDLIKIESFSSFIKLKRIFAFLRFIYNTRNRKSKKLGPLTVSELSQATKHLVRMSQGDSFSPEISILEKGKHLPNNSRILKLNPFLDSENILRVGGRLHLAKLDYNQKHPMLLSSKHPLTRLIFRSEHLRLLHAGPRLLLCSIRENYWPISGSNLAKKTVHECIRCFRTKPRGTTPLMGVLPEIRVIPQPPFFTTGCDYAGPIYVKQRQGRGSRDTKAYIAIFVCFATRAIHLELVSSLTTEAFMSMVRRFVSRRGKPQKIYSDNGRNFVGARSELAELAKFLQTDDSNIRSKCINDGIEWSFSPPRAPHFGGIWEAGVKSCKYHLKRVIGNSKLTYEEMSTLLAQIEAILNSRPLIPLSPDPSDCDLLTPAHFLIGRRLISVPDPNLIDIKTTRLSRFQLIQQHNQVFWKRWSAEYLHELQERTKWKQWQQQLKLGTLVLLRDDQAPPLCWRLGRVQALHPGPDGVTRVASIRTPQGIAKRALTQLCPLPLEEDPPV
nr:unnamed protein product [Callosobruchus analis]